jgi:2-polyprenyl-3-methyl-5-hydroxy-6-metoxy-1,4-benzoquinol methylase
MKKDPSQWMDVTKIMDKSTVSFGRYISYWFEHSPRRALNYLSYYKFASKMIGKKKRVLDIGCNEGLGTWLLAVECGFAKGIDFDDEAIQIATNNWVDDRISFEAGDLFSMKPNQWDGVVAFDVIEYVLPEKANEFLRAISLNLSSNGIAIVGTPSLEGQKYASPVSKIGYINLYSFEQLEKQMHQYFKHVFMFCANDEVIHTGFPQMAHYLIALGCKKR